MLPTIVTRICYTHIEHIKILKLVMEMKPDLTLKNKKGQTAIDITNSKIIMSLFWHYLTGTEETKQLEAMPSEKYGAMRLASDANKVMNKSRDLLKDLKIKEPEVAKVQDAKQKEKKGALIGPKPISRMVRSIVTLLGRK